jgi:hypothetical protein
MSKAPNDDSGSILVDSVLSAEVGANTVLTHAPDQNLLISAWCSRLDVWNLKHGTHLQSLAFVADDGINPAEIDPNLLPPLAGSAPSEQWSSDLLPITAAVLSASQATLLVSAGSKVHIYDLPEKSGRLVESGELAGDGGLITSLAIGADGRTLVGTSAFGSVLVWDLETGEKRLRLSSPTTPKGCAVAGRDTVVAVADDSGRVRSWDIETGVPLVEFQAHEGPITRLLGNLPDTLITASLDGSVRIWDLNAGAMRLAPLHHSDVVFDCCLSTNQQFLLTASFDSHVAVWSLENGQLVEWYKEKGPVYRVVPIHGEERAVISTAGAIKVLDLSSAFTEYAAARLADDDPTDVDVLASGRFSPSLRRTPPSPVASASLPREIDTPLPPEREQPPARELPKEAGPPPRKVEERDDGIEEGGAAAEKDLVATESPLLGGAFRGIGELVKFRDVLLSLVFGAIIGSLAGVLVFAVRLGTPTGELGEQHAAATEELAEESGSVEHDFAAGMDAISRERLHLAESDLADEDLERSLHVIVRQQAFLEERHTAGSLELEALRDRVDQLEHQVGEVARRSGMSGGLSASIVFFAIFGLVFASRRIGSVSVRGGLQPKKNRSYNSPTRS